MIIGKSGQWNIFVLIAERELKICNHVWQIMLLNDLSMWQCYKETTTKFKKSTEECQIHNTRCHQQNEYFPGSSITVLL